MNKALTKQQLKAIRIDYESSLDPNHVIAARHGIDKSTVRKKAKLGKWNRRPDYNSRKGVRVVDPKLLERAKTLYEKGLTPVEISRAVNRTRTTVERWQRLHGWQFIGPRMPSDNNSQDARDGWPKVTTEWPVDQRFDTPGRHYHELDKKFVPVFRAYGKADKWATM